ncbi:hypothetical protein [Sulfuriflexus mobilis]|uniref:hypothetical protein n=1 Tax=Sulfuriflexus mobilis TaxID=1811807 RepID=UPI000F840B95|nr:hypothetical protein [Sulfuriflexus mobilis]
MKSKLVVGSAMGLAALAIAIDHTRHQLPEPVTPAQDYMVIEEEGGSPCGLNGAPCGLLNESPCGLNGSPCGL